MASFNRVILVGNLTRDVELKYLQSGTAVGEFGLAINDRRKTAAGDWVDETVFVDITLWGRTAEIAGEYLQKGSPVLIEGRLKYDTWEKEGKKYSKLRVVGDKMQMLGARQGAGQASGQASGQANGQGGGGGASGSAGPNFANRPGQRPVTARSNAAADQGASEYGMSAEPDSHGEAGVPEEDIPF
ncbi:MAG: single-stranded DNA-binding protein [Pirellulales bacterium]